MQAITAATETYRPQEASTDSELSNSDTEDTATPANTDKTSSSPTDDEQFSLQSRPNTSIAQDVFVKRGQFGRVASQWFSRQGWGIGKATGESQAVAAPTDKQAELADEPVTAVPAGDDQPSSNTGPVDEGSAATLSKGQQPTSVAAMIPKVLRVSRLLLASSRSFFFSYDLDLTRNMASLGGSAQAPIIGKLDPLVTKIFRPRF